MLAGLAGLYLKMNQAMRQMAGRGDAREISNNPLIVQESARAATIDDVVRVDVRVTKLEKRMDSHMKEAAETREGMREHLDEMRDRMDDKFQTVTEELRELSRAVGRLEGS